MQGMMGRKVGMTRVFDESGEQIPVTVVEVGPCVVLQRKTRANDGYDAVVLGFQSQKPQRVKKPAMGLFKKAGVEPARFIQEFRVGPEESLSSGEVLTVSAFNDVSFVDVSGVTKGYGFQGVVRRHGMAKGRMTHGGHSKRRPGSIGQASYPARVHKGKKMPGHMGRARRTQRGLKVVQVKEEDNVLIVRGSIPGPAGRIVTVSRSYKTGPGST